MQREQGGQSEEYANTGLHCRQATVQTAPNEDGTNENLNPASVALQIDVDAVTSNALMTRDLFSEADPNDQRSPGSVVELHGRVLRNTLMESRVSKVSGTKIMPTCTINVTHRALICVCRLRQSLS